MRRKLPIRVGLSVDAIASEMTGIGRYTVELARRLPTHREIGEVILFHGPERQVQVDGLLGPSSPAKGIWASGLRRLRKLLGSPRMDIMHGPNYFLPSWASPGVVTFHDLSVFHFPEFHPSERIAEFERNLRRTVATTEHILTDCATIRREVIDFSGIDPARVTAVPLGVGAEFRPLSSDERAPVLRRYGLPETGYGLTVSSLEPRKRIHRLLEAWRILPKPLRLRFPVVIAGARGWMNESLGVAIEQAGREGWAVWLGFVPDQDLPAIYSGASLFIFPSIYEGFGLPPLEAMATGVPTLVASGTCLDEVTQGAAMLVEPEDLTGFASDIERGLLDEAWRLSAVSRGLKVAASYTWERCADETVAVYQRVLQQ